MLLWLIIALLTAAAIMAVLVPLGRPPAVAEQTGHAKRVYRDQLNEIERDRADGRLNADEAESARAEVARRLLAVEADAAGHAGGRQRERAARDIGSGSDRHPGAFAGALSRTGRA